MTEKTPQDPSSVALESTRKKKWPWIVGALLLLLLIIVALIGLLNGKEDEEATKPAASVTTTHSPSATASKATTSSEPKETSPSTSPAEKKGNEDTRTVELRATATDSGNLLYGVEGATNTDKFEKEWTKTIEDVKNSEAYTLTVAGDTADKSSEVTCQILVDGKVEQEAKGSAAAGEATCVLPAKFL